MTSVGRQSGTRKALDVTSVLGKSRGKLWRFRVLMAASVLVGLSLRLLLIVQSGWRMDYDEAMIGLLALRVLRGEWMVFVPAQPTLGAVEAYLLAPFFRIFGATRVTFRLISLGFSAGYILTIGHLARRAFDERVGGFAGMLAAVAPPYMVVVGLKTWGATIETIVLGNLLFLVTGWLVEQAQTSIQRLSGLTLVGLLTGLMFWLSWLGFYYFIPSMLLLVWQGRKALAEGWWVGLLAFLMCDPFPRNRTGLSGG